MKKIQPPVKFQHKKTNSSVLSSMRQTVQDYATQNHYDDKNQSVIPEYPFFRRTPSTNVLRSQKQAHGQLSKSISQANFHNRSQISDYQQPFLQQIQNISNNPSALPSALNSPAKSTNSTNQHYSQSFLQLQKLQNFGSKEAKQEFKKEKSSKILKQVLEETIMMTEASSPKHNRSIAHRDMNQSVNGLSYKKLSEHIKKVDLSRICNFVSASQFGEVQSLKMRIDNLQKENDELSQLNKEMNEFRQALNNETEQIDHRRYHLLKSQVINLTRHVTILTLPISQTFLQNKILMNTVEQQSKLTRETERILHYLEEAIMLSSKKAELIYQKRREKLLEKKRQEELAKLQNMGGKKRRKQHNTENQEQPKLNEIGINDYMRQREDDELIVIDQIREEQLKDFFKSSDPRNYIQKLRNIFHSTLQKERKVYNKTLETVHPLLNMKEGKKKVNVEINQQKMFQCESKLTELLKSLSDLYQDITIRDCIPSSGQILQTQQLLRQSIDSLMLIGLMPFGDKQSSSSINILTSESKSLLGLSNYEEWARFTSDKVNRDAMPKVAGCTIEKFIKLNQEVVTKRQLLKFLFNKKKDRQAQRKDLELFLNDWYKFHLKQRTQIVLLSRENLLIKNFMNEGQSHLDKFSQYIYQKYNLIGKDIREKVYMPYQLLKKAYHNCVIHERAKKFLFAFVDLFEKLSKDQFEVAFEEFYKEEGPDLKMNARIQDLIVLHNRNQKLLMHNLNDYEKIMSVKLLREQQELEIANQNEDAKEELIEDEDGKAVNESKDLTYEKFVVNIKRSPAVLR